jgi:hypothetical protein
MNNNTPAVLRSLIVYAVCVPLAVWFGYLIAQQWDRSTLGIMGVVALVLAAPILLRWHYPILIFSWNLGMVIFFLPGSPVVSIPMIVLSLGISVLHRTLNSDARFISAPQIAWPLIFLAAVVLFTAKLTGGIGLRTFGSDAMGGRRYLAVLVPILGYFALTARRIPLERAGLYVALFFLPSCSGFIGDLAAFLPSSLYFIFAVFPASGYDMNNGDSGFDSGITRFAGMSYVGLNVFIFMLARYGIRGIFMSGRPGRLFLFLLFSVLILFGGFRLSVITCLLIFGIQFYLERLYQTRLLMLFIFMGIIMATLCIPFANKLPPAFQRSLAFLPLNIDPAIKANAESSSDWRLIIWKSLLPQVPQYLLLGKGYKLSALDYQMATTKPLEGGISAADWSATIVGNYHSGPLSVIIFLGIWGVIAVVWFWIASVRALYDNYRYGDPSLRSINTLFFAYFVVKIIIFLFVFGALDSDMGSFAGLMGLSISLNGGIRRPAKATTQETETPRVPAPNQPRFQPYYQR